MAEPTPRSIQATLFDYFQDTEYFDLQEANELLLEHQQRDINAESIRARIYEGINKGLFERVGKGLYTVTRKDEQGRENTCLLINGDGRDLSMFPDNSVDALITDHPYSLKNSLKGGNRNFADYELFQYNEQDFKEKLRVLKPNCFLVEFLPEENGDNYQYLFKVKELARKVGFEYYAKVPWKKGDNFVANTGRKAKNTEDIVFFTKGRARALRPDAKKNKQYDASHAVVVFKEHLPGSNTVIYSDMGGMGSSSETTVAPIDVNIRISVLKEDAEKAKGLLSDGWYNALQDSFENSPLDIYNGGEYTLEELYDMPVQDYILKYIKKRGLSFDDLSKGPVEHFMSGAAGMLPTVFDVEPVNKKDKIHQAEKPVLLLEQILNFVTLPGETALDQFAGSGVLGEAALNTGRNSILIEKDADAYNKLCERIAALGNMETASPEQDKLVNLAIDALEAAHDGAEHQKAFAEHHNNSDISLAQAFANLSALMYNPQTPEQEAEQEALEAAAKAIQEADCCDLSLSKAPKVLECSSRGDRRFCALFANVTIRGKEKSIEEWYQDAKRTVDAKRAGKGKPFDHIICPFTGDKLPVKDASDLYRGLWITYLSNHPELVEYASQFDEFSDSFKDPSARQQQIDAYSANPFDKTAEFFYRHSGLLSGADIIDAYVKGNTEEYVAIVKASHWYKNMAAKMKKPSLDSQVQTAATKSAEQMSLFQGAPKPREPRQNSR